MFHCGIIRSCWLRTNVWDSLYIKGPKMTFIDEMKLHMCFVSLNLCTRVSFELICVKSVSPVSLTNRNRRNLVMTSF